jgi:hypothetical protein
MHYYLYQITNTVNGKVYVGVHKTSNINDGYMGSGKVIKRAIEKYGIENFTKIILETFETVEAMYAAEKEMVTEEFLTRDDVYNLRRGGTGGFDYINRTGKNFNGTQLSAVYINDPERHREISVKGGKSCKAQKKGWHDPNNKNCGWISREHQQKACLAAAAAESNIKRKTTMSLAHHQQAEKNSQFGTCWIWHELIGNKKCKKELLPEYIEQGWSKGRFLL